MAGAARPARAAGRRLAQRWRAGASRHRGLWLAIAIAALGLLALRTALPFALAPWLERRLAEQLDARVEIGDVDLGLLRGRIALQDGALYPPDPATQGALLAWQELSANISWLHLLERQVLLQAIEVVEPKLRLVRLPEGGLNLAALLARDEPEEPRQEPSTWSFAVRRGAVERGAVRFRDLTVEQEQVLRFRIEELRVRHLSLEPGTYERPGHFELSIDADGSELEVQGRVQPTSAGFALDVRLALRDAPLDAVEAYAGEAIGWSRLAGHVDADLRYERSGEERGRVFAALAVSDLAVSVPDAQEPGLGWARLAVEGADLDLDARSVEVERVALSGATLLVRPSGPPLPILAMNEEEPPGDAGLEEQEAAAASEDPERSASAGGADERTGAERREPWRWRIGRLVVHEDSAIRVRVEGAPGDEVARYAVELGATGVRSDGRFPVTLALQGEEGRMRAEGELAVEPPGFDGRIDWESLDVARLLALLAPGSATWLESLNAEGELDVRTLAGAAGPSGAAGDATRAAARDGPRRVVATGTLDLTDTRLRSEDEALFRVGFERLALDIEALRIPLAGAERDLALRIARARLFEPDVRLTLTEQGLVLPERRAEPEGRAEPEAESAEATSFLVEVARLELSGGELSFADRRVDPAVEVELANVSGEAEELRAPDFAVEAFGLEGSGLGDEPVRIAGSYRDETLVADVSVAEVPLAPFNPYATAYSSYFIQSGSATADLDLQRSPGSFEADLHLVLDDFALRGEGGSRLVLRQFGVPLHVALALLRGPSGRITLDVPIVRRDAGTGVDVVELVGSAVFRSLVNAAASPLRVLTATGSLGGAVGRAALGALVPGRGGDASGGDEALASEAASRLAPIAFLPGRAIPTAAGREQIDRLGEMLSAGPELRLHVEPSAGPEDARWLRERGTLDPDGGGAQAQLRRLAQARGSRIETLLAARHEIPAERVAVEPPAIRSGQSGPAGDGGPPPDVAAAAARASSAGDAQGPGVAFWLALERS